MAKGMDCDEDEKIQELAPTGLQKVVGHPTMMRDHLWNMAQKCQMQTPPARPLARSMQNPSSSSTYSGFPTTTTLTAHGVAKGRDMKENEPPLCHGVNREFFAEEELVTDEEWRGRDQPGRCQQTSVESHPPQVLPSDPGHFWRSSWTARPRR